MTPKQWAELLKRLDPSAMVDCSEKWVATDGEFDIRILNRLIERVQREAWENGYANGYTDGEFGTLGYNNWRDHA